MGFSDGRNGDLKSDSYELDGKQYVALAAGRALIAFSLE